MKHDPVRSGTRRPLNLSVDTGIVERAREHGINLSQLMEESLRVAIKKEDERRWKEENREALEGYNRWVEKNGLPLEHLRVW